MEKLISDELRTALCEQIGHEIYNSHLYLFICGFLKNKGLDNLAKIFEAQVTEEREHAQQIFDLLTDLNANIYVPEIQGIELTIEDMMDIAEIYLGREIETTTSLDEIKRMAFENPVVEEFMRHMVDQQRKEYEEASTFMDKAEIVGSNWMNALIWDSSLG